MRKILGVHLLAAAGAAVLLLVLVLVLGHERVSAQGSPTVQLPDSATLEDYLAYAAEHSPALKAAAARWDAATRVGPQRRSLPDPTLSLSATQMERRTSLGVSQMLPFFGKRALEGEMADEEAAAAERQVEVARLTVFARVVAGYAEYAFSRQALANVRESLALVQQLEEVTLTRYRTGEAPYADLVRAQVERGRLEDEVRTWEDRLPAEGALLNAAIGRPADAPLPEPGALRPHPLTLDEGSLLAELRQANPELASIRHEVAAARLGIDRARRAYYPDLGIGLEYMRSGEMNRSGVGAMVSVTLPVRRQRLRAGVEEAEARHEVVRALEQEAGNLLEAEARGALFRYNDALRKGALYQDELVPQARQSLVATEAAYRAGAATYQDLIESYRTVLAFELVLARAVADQVRHLAELELYVGRRLRP
jgi:outer membrane protein, heavy metal efflux system